MQPLKHMATIHLGIGLIITIFQGRKVFGKIEENFLLPAQGFLFFPSSQILEDELFPQGCFAAFFFCRSEPTLVLDANHLSF